MNLEVINNLITNAKDNKKIQGFIKELSDYLLMEAKGKENTRLQDNDNKLDDLREENCLYQVVDRSVNGVYLQNTKNNKIFEETDIPQEIQDIIGNDYILRYKDGKYIIEEELTDEFFNRMINIEEYEKIQNDFIKDSKINEIDENTRFSVISREEDYTVLNYENNIENQIKVPNVLVPFFIDIDTILYYKDGKFEKEI